MGLGVLDLGLQGGEVAVQLVQRFAEQVQFGGQGLNRFLGLVSFTQGASGEVIAILAHGNLGLALPFVGLAGQPIPAPHQLLAVGDGPGGR